MEVAINAINGFWHVDCFVCHRCKKKFEGEERIKERLKNRGVEFQDKEKDPKEENQEREKELESGEKKVGGVRKEIKEEGERRSEEDGERVTDGRKVKEKKELEDENERREQERKETEGEKGIIDKEEEEGKANEKEERDKIEKKSKEKRKDDEDDRREDRYCSYTIKDDKLFHFECYKEEFFERCHVCNKFCENEYYQTEGKAVHEGCLEVFKEWKMSKKETEELNKKETGKSVPTYLFFLLILNINRFSLNFGKFYIHLFI